MAVVVFRGCIFALMVVVWSLAGCASPEVGPLRPIAVAHTDPRADGYIVQIDRDAGEVYIDLTARDHLRVGMTFECYDPRLGVKRDSSHVVRPLAGLATLEVVQVGDEYSICRVKRANLRDLAIGDPLAGYDFFKNFSPHMAMFGDFDLNGDGVATPSEREELVWLLQKWGAVVDDDITVHTDYLLLGTRPKSPNMHDPSPVTEPGDAVDHRTAEQKEYDRLLEVADSFAMPVFNLNRILALIGYRDPQIAQR